MVLICDFRRACSASVRRGPVLRPLRLPLDHKGCQRAYCNRLPRSMPALGLRAEPIERGGVLSWRTPLMAFEGVKLLPHPNPQAWPPFSPGEPSGRIEAPTKGRPRLKLKTVAALGLADVARGVGGQQQPLADQRVGAAVPTPLSAAWSWSTAKWASRRGNWRQLCELDHFPDRRAVISWPCFLPWTGPLRLRRSGLFCLIQTSRQLSRRSPEAGPPQYLSVSGRRHRLDEPAGLR
jgi:hypothetical protein